MTIEVTVNLSKKEVDSVARAIDQSIKRIIVDEWCVKIDTKDDSPDNINKWMSDERKVEFRDYMNSSFPDLSFDVVSIKLSK